MSKMSRRKFLGGAGAMLALPLLHSLMPRQAWAVEPVMPKRMFHFHVQFGIILDNWTPQQVGDGFQLTPLLEPLGAGLRDHVNVISGLDNSAADGDGPHAREVASFLSGKPIGDKNTPTSGTSVDQVFANATSASTPLHSLALGFRSFSFGTDGYSSTYRNHISWTNANTPKTRYLDPQEAFNAMFAGSNPAATNVEEDKRRRYKTSVLDYALQEINSLKPKLAKHDSVRLDQYLTAVETLEGKLSRSSSASCSATGPAMTDDPEQFAWNMMELMALAFTCDGTRAITCMIDAPSSEYPWLGFSEDHHEPLSHHGRNPDYMAKMDKITTWHMGLVADFLQRLQAVDEGGSTILDNSIGLFGAGLNATDTNAHKVTNLPLLTAGHAGGTVRGGRHLSYSNGDLAQLHLAMLQASGVNISSFGDAGTSPLAGFIG